MGLWQPKLTEGSFLCAGTTALVPLRKGFFQKLVRHFREWNRCLLQLHPRRPCLGAKQGTANTDYGVQLRSVSTYPSSFNLLTLFGVGDEYYARGNAHCVLPWMSISCSWWWHVNSSKKTQNEVVIKASYFVMEWQMLKLKLLPPRERKQRGFGTDWGTTSGAQIETCFSWGPILLLTLQHLYDRKIQLLSLQLLPFAISFLEAKASMTLDFQTIAHDLMENQRFSHWRKH